MHGDHEDLPVGIVRPLTIAIDFDDTYTSHPEMWAQVIAVLRFHGHRVICVTCRRDTPENREICVIPGVRTYFTSLGSKLAWTKEKGFQVDIWIDDDPKSVVHGR